MIDSETGEYYIDTIAMDNNGRSYWFKGDTPYYFGTDGKLSDERVPDEALVFNNTNSSNLDNSNIDYSKIWTNIPLPEPITVSPPYNPMDINITFDQIEEIIKLLESAANQLRNTWDGKTKVLLNQLESSWVGTDCEEYTAKLLKMNKRIHRTINALDLIRQTFTNAKDLSVQHQATATNIVAKVEE